MLHFWALITQFLFTLYSIDIFIGIILWSLCPCNSFHFCLHICTVEWDDSRSRCHRYFPSCLWLFMYTVILGIGDYRLFVCNSDRKGSLHFLAARWRWSCRCLWLMGIGFQKVKLYCYDVLQLNWVNIQFDIVTWENNIIHLQKQ